MNQENIIYDLAAWIDKRLDTRLSLDIVAAKSGYSKWHLQRMFRKVTGYRLADYIRGRRLSCAAVELRMTRTAILDIALKYHFDSQQTFSRTFKKYFRQTPGAYRDGEEWDCSLLYPPLQRGAFPVVQPKLIQLPRRFLTGMMHYYTCCIEQIGKFDIDVRADFWRRHFHAHAELPTHIYGLTNICPNSGKGQTLEIAYATIGETAVTEADNTGILIQEGNYIQFDYAGPAEGLQPFIIAINQSHLQRLRVVRRKGADIERYHFQGNKTQPWRSTFVRCSYFIPCANANDVAARL